ncbi:hypothetical protein ABW19_dt0206251 [Dactylella cylindrospora]|nr:hypothetical protein ABW19_dt0206251 [Dactylella cylindrospora]
MADSSDNSPTPLAVIKPTSTDPSGEYTLLSYTSTPSPFLEVKSISSPIDPSLTPLVLSPTSLPAHLQLPPSQIHVIISTNSGLKAAQSYYDSLLSPLLKHLAVDHTVHTTTSPTSIAEFASNITSNNLQNLIILLSGDTGVTEYLNAISPSAASNNILSILPLGTANAFSSAHHLSLISLLHGVPKSFPTFTATFSPGSREHGSPPPAPPTDTLSIRGCVVASYGFHASIVGGSETPEYREYGIQKFKMVAEEVLKGTFLGGEGGGFKPYNATIKGLESVKGGKHSYLMLALVDRMEPTFVISPKSINGEVWTLYTGDITGEQLIGVMMGAYAGGKHVEAEGVGYEKTDGFRIEGLEDEQAWKRWVCVDGRFVEVPKDGWVDVKVEGGDNGFTVLA